MERPNANDILTKYLAGQATEEEAAIVESWHLNYDLGRLEDLDIDEQVKDLDEVWLSLEQPDPAFKRISLWPKLAVAAAVVLVTGLALFFYIQENDMEKQQLKLAADLLPAKNNAVLTLANGQKIILDDTGKGEIARQSGITITKAADGTIIYNSNASPELMSAQAGKLQYNTIATPRGGKYQLNLPDGTRVWLNAASQLKFPVVFAPNERKVELIGEAYFEVSKVMSKNKETRMPFVVVTDKQNLQVLGTHFNINAYPDEQDLKTTLFEGSVKVVPAPINGSVKTPADIILKPGQQSVLNNRKLTITKADLNEVMSWKNGMFQFNDTKLSDIMIEASRWYDVDVVYEGNVPVIRFSGEVSRSVNAAAFLEMLKYLDVKFHIESIEGNRKRIVVSK